MKTPRFSDIVNMIAARRAYQGGQPISDIARQAGVSTSTVRKWIRATGHEGRLTERVVR
jgi:transposase-like protein